MLMLAGSAGFVLCSISLLFPVSTCLLYVQLNITVMLRPDIQMASTDRGFVPRTAAMRLLRQY